MPSNETLHEPWASFLEALDAQLVEPTELHCLGGFVIAEQYGLDRVTADVDVLNITKGTGAADLARIAGRNTALHKKHKVYLDIVTIAPIPEDYASRLVDLFPNRFRNLVLKALERHDLVLAKLERNDDRDREDVKRLAAGPGLDVTLLRERYASELRYQLGRPQREDITLQLWIEIIEEIQARRAAKS